MEQVITVKKITDVNIARDACRFTMHSQSDSKISLASLYGCEHSPIRTQLFWIEMIGIPSFVSVHFVRHTIGVSGHFVQTMRQDRGADDVANRLTPVNHAMLANAQALINMARKRLCHKASPETREVMEKIRTAIGGVDPALGNVMVPECYYRGFICHERRMCGKMPNVKHYLETWAWYGE